jgi:hypothetical protein
MSKQFKDDYPVGKEIDTIHPYTGEFVKATVDNHWVDTINRDGGIVARIDDGDKYLYQNVSSEFLREDGTGV